MKGLTLTQPWASLVAEGAKRIETRSWRTAYRGPLLIMAAKGISSKAISGGERGLEALCATEPFASALFGGTNANLTCADDLPRGQIVAVARLANVITTGAAVFDLRYNAHLHAPHEQAFGGYGPGRYAWLLDDVQAIEPTRIPKGLVPCYQGLWDAPPHVVSEASILAGRSSG